MVAAMDFEKSGLARVTFDKRTNQVLLVHGNVSLAMTIGSRNARLNGAAVVLPVAVVVVGDRAMVPAKFVASALGLSEISVKPAMDGKAAEAVSPKISGRVLYAGRPMPNAILRLVRAEDFSFVPGFRARTGGDGRYSFDNVANGAYRVYASVADNPGYFNRTTSPLRFVGAPLKADDIQMGRVLEARDPPSGAILSPKRDVVFTWTSCASGARYHLSVVDPATNEEVFSAETTMPYSTVPISHLSPGCLYEWRVAATDTGGAFLGGTPGCGAQPWTFRVALD
jgi:hypothetical protein